MVTGVLNTKPQCPSCKAVVDGYTSVNCEGTPEPGDITICVYCNSILQFDSNMKMILASHEVIEECGLLEISRAQNRARRFKADVDFVKSIKEVLGDE
ncbi:MAG: hypothetical protein GWN00_19865 [Aliifodinibius sp.]|nr:hypothetical protein [Fodinibius sp.]NIY26978.1 hypothetical protein [Fodinibius sp.]